MTKVRNTTAQTPEVSREALFRGLDLPRIRRFGAALASLLRCDDTLLFHGPIGSGKTTLIRALLRALPEFSGGVIVSPTYTLAQSYTWRQGEAWHFDLYRLKTEEEVLYSGLYDVIGVHLCLIEWPLRLGDAPGDSLDLFLDFDDSVLSFPCTDSGKAGASSALPLTDKPLADDPPQERELRRLRVLGDAGRIRKLVELSHLRVS